MHVRKLLYECVCVWGGALMGSAGGGGVCVCVCFRGMRVGWDLGGYTR